MNLGLFSTHSVIIYNTLLPFSSPSFYYKLNLKLIFHHLQRTKLSLGTVFNLNLDNPVILQKENWNICWKYRSSEDSPYTPPSDSQRLVYATLLKRLKEEPLRGIVGPDYVTGSNLPSHSDIHISCLTGLKIQVQPNVKYKLCMPIIFVFSLLFEIRT